MMFLKHARQQKSRPQLGRLFVFFISVSLLTACATHRQTQQLAKYLSSSEATEIGSTLAPPPTEKSAEAEVDINKMLRIQRTRKPSECAAAEKTEPVNIVSFFGNGPLSDRETNELGPLFLQLLVDIRTVYHPAKQKFARLRPYDSDSRLTPCIKREKSYSYPSGHTTTAFVFAHALSELFPSRTEIFFKRAEKIAHDRVLGGVHFPSDIEAGKILASTIWDHLKTNKKFLNDLRTGH